jgi:hypothetical protein
VSGFLGNQRENGKKKQPTMEKYHFLSLDQIQQVLFFKKLSQLEEFL